MADSSENSVLSKKLDQSGEALFILDEQLKFLIVSGFFADLYGHEISELKGKSFHDMLPVTEHAAIEGFFEEAERKKSPGSIIVHFKDINGKAVPSVIIVTWERERGRFLCSAEIISRDSQWESFQPERERLLHVIHQKEAELKKSRTEMELLVSAIPYRFQEPLRMVTGFLERLEKKYGDQLDPKAQQYIFYASDGAMRMRRIIMDLMRYNDVPGQPKFEKVDMNAVMDKVKLQFWRIIKDKKAAIKYDSLPVINSSWELMGQVFHILIGNALTFQRDDVIPIIHIEAFEKDDFWQFFIIDNGIGIEKESFNTIFQPFRKLHSESSYPGSGMGLATGKKIVETLGGELWVQSSSPEGTTFAFKLPVLPVTRLSNII